MEEKYITILAEPTRFRIVEMLRERPLSVNELTAQLPVSQPQVSKHLRALHDAGLVKIYPVAQQRYYGIDPVGMKQVFSWAKSFMPLWDARSEIANMYLQAVRSKQAQIPTVTQPFTIERVIAAPRELVWEAWTVPVLLAQWFAPDYYIIPLCELDVRPGGNLKITMQAPDGTQFPMTGMFTEVVPLEKLRTIQSPLDEQGKKMFDLDLTVLLTDDSTNTKVTIQASVPFATAKAAPHLSGLQPGWEQNLANLGRMLRADKEEQEM